MYMQQILQLLMVLKNIFLQWGLTSLEIWIIQILDIENPISPSNSTVGETRNWFRDLTKFFRVLSNCFELVENSLVKKDYCESKIANFRKIRSLRSGDFICFANKNFTMSKKEENFEISAWKWILERFILETRRGRIRLGPKSGTVLLELTQKNFYNLKPHPSKSRRFDALYSPFNWSALVQTLSMNLSCVFAEIIDKWQFASKKWWSLMSHNLWRIIYES